MNNHHTVSVVIPCYKQAGFLAEAIESVLAQTHRHFEIIVVDDGSPDNTSGVAASYPSVRCIRQENRGLSAARNMGLGVSKGEFLVFLDADDRLTTNSLESGLDCFRKFPVAAFVVGKHKRICAEGLPTTIQHRRLIEKDHYIELLRANYIGCPATVMYRRSVFDVVRGFDTTVNAASDYDLYLRIAQKFPICCHAEFVAEYRSHGENMSSNHQLMGEQVNRVLGSQLKQASGNKAYEEACRSGIKFYRRLYRTAGLVQRMQTNARRKDWSGTLESMVSLLWFNPRVFGETIGRKLRLVISQELGLSREAM